jgi:hypothetical protein
MVHAYSMSDARLYLTHGESVVAVHATAIPTKEAAVELEQNSRAWWLGSK